MVLYVNYRRATCDINTNLLLWPEVPRSPRLILYRSRDPGPEMRIKIHS
jgi:hypothetical protein